MWALKIALVTVAAIGWGKRTAETIWYDLR
jgi:hypothetical protein